MSVLKMIKRSVLDILDVPTLVVAFLFLYLVVFYISIPLYDAMASSIVEYLTSGSFLKAAYAFFAGLGVLGWIALVLYFLINLYLFGFVVARVLQRRLGEPRNPFKRAAERILGVFASLALVTSLPFLFTLLFLLYYPLPISNLFLALSILLTFTWSLVFLPVVPAVILETPSRHAVREGALAGKVTWWKSLIAILVLSLLAWVVSYAVSLVSPSWAPFLYSLLTFLIPPVVAAEAFLLFKEGS